MSGSHLDSIATPAKPQLLPCPLQLRPLPVFMNHLAPTHEVEINVLLKCKNNFCWGTMTLCYTLSRST